MFTRDFIMHQIQQLSQVLARVLFLKSNHDHENALKEIDQALQQIPEFGPLLGSSLTRDELLALFVKGKGFDAEQALILSDILIERAFLVEDPEQHLGFQYALWLTEKALQDGGSVVLPLDIHQRIDWLADLVEQRGSAGVEGLFGPNS